MIQEQVLEGEDFLKRHQKYPLDWVFVIDVAKKDNFYLKNSFPSLSVMQTQQSSDFSIDHLLENLDTINDTNFFAEQLWICINENSTVSFNLYNIVETKEKYYLLKLIPIDDNSGTVHTIVCCLQNEKEQRSYYRKYIQEKYFMQRLYEVFPSPFYITDNKDIVIEYNGAAKKNISMARRQSQDVSIANFIEEIELINEDYSLVQPDEIVSAAAFEHRTTVENRITGLRAKGQNHVEWYRTFAAYLNLPGYGVAGYNESITTQKQVEENIISLNNILNAIINSTTDTIVFVNTENKITVLNEAASEHYRKINERPISIGEDIANVIPKDRVDIFNKTLEELKQKKQVQREHELIYPNGERVWFNRKFYPVYDELERYLGYVVYSEDISRQKEYELTLYRQNEQLNEIARIQTEELIKPLTSVSELVKILIATASLNKGLLNYLNESAIQLEEVIKSKTYIGLI